VSEHLKGLMPTSLSLTSVMARRLSDPLLDYQFERLILDFAGDPSRFPWPSIPYR